MKTKTTSLRPFARLAGLLGLSFALVSIHSQTALPPFGGPFVAPAGAGTPVTTTYILPPDGRLDYSTITIPQFATVRFVRNEANTPVYMIATGEVDIQGVIDVSGSAGTTTTAGISGPGGFDGGAPAIGVSEAGDGLGPGAARGRRANPAVGAGHAAYGTAPLQGSPQNGEEYGSQLLMPLVGGSGGGGSNVGGGGGGGAILIKSETVINTGASGIVRARGGGAGHGNGSGGAIRLVAPVIQGNGLLDVQGGANSVFGNGRIRCDLTDRSNFSQLRHEPSSAPFTSDQYLPLAFPPDPAPSVRIVSVGAANVPAGSPAGFTIVFPVNASLSQPVVVEASGFGAPVDIAIKRTPISGPALPITTATIPSPGLNQTAATVSIPVDFPANVPITVNVWTVPL